MVFAVTWFQAAKGVAIIVAALATIGYLLDRWAKNYEPSKPAVRKTPPPRPVTPLPQKPVRVDRSTPSPEEVFPHLSHRKKVVRRRR